MRPNPYYQPYWVNRNELEHGALPLSDSELEHYGVLGMKWGVRNYQNEDGSLTALGKLRQSKPVSGTDSFTYSSDVLKSIHNIYQARSKSKLSDKVALRKAIGTMTHITSIIPATIKDIEPLAKKADQEALKEILNMDGLTDEQKAAILAYEALYNANLEEYFSIRIQTEGNKRVMVFVNKNTGYVCRTLSEAKTYMKTIGSRQREKNVQGNGVEVKKGDKLSTKTGKIYNKIDTEDKQKRGTGFGKSKRGSGFS